MYKKPIIVFEGIEGSGKSHHISVVSKYLKRKKISYIKIREPGGNLNSEKIRKLILNIKSDFNKNTDLLLYLAARSENVNLIKKTYNKKKWLLNVAKKVQNQASIYTKQIKSCKLSKNKNSVL